MTATAPPALRGPFPPAPYLRAAAALAVPLAAVVASAGLIGGPATALGVALGALVSVNAAVTSVGRADRLAIAGLVALAAGASAVIADLDHGRTVATGACMVGLAAAQVPLNRRSAGLGALLVVIPAVVTSVHVAGGGARVTLGALIGSVAVMLLAAALRMSAPASPVDARVAVRHAVALALAVALATPVVTATYGHGYWLVLTVAALLRPVPGETVASAGKRVLGSVAGVGLAAAAVLLLPGVVSAALAVGGVLVSVAWSLAREEFWQALYGTPVIVLVASSDPAGSQVGASAERLLLVGGGAALAVLGALLLARLDLSSAGGRTPRSAG